MNLVIITCPCWFISHNKCCTLVPDVDNGGIWSGAGYTPELSSLFPQCCHEPEAALKNKVYLKEENENEASLCSCNMNRYWDAG